MKVIILFLDYCQLSNVFTKKKKKIFVFINILSHEKEYSMFHYKYIVLYMYIQFMYTLIVKNITTKKTLVSLY